MSVPLHPSSPDPQPVAGGEAQTANPAQADAQSDKTASRKSTTQKSADKKPPHKKNADKKSAGKNSADKKSVAKKAEANESKKSKNGVAHTGGVASSQVASQVVLESDSGSDSGSASGLASNSSLKMSDKAQSSATDKTLPAGAVRALAVEREMTELGTSAAFDRFFQHLCDVAQAAGRVAPTADEQERFRSAFLWAVECHGDQSRDSGAPYWTHLLAVAESLATLYYDPDSILTALLHDVVEDTPATIEEVRARFGDDVARLVNGVTKLGQIELNAPHQADAENFRKLVLAMSDDIRVLLVKLSDRLHNMRTLTKRREPEPRRRKAIETLEVHAPLAERIGLDEIRSELEELAFHALHPRAYASLRARMENLQIAEAQATSEIVSELQGVLAKAGIAAEVSGRVKSLYSVWRKMQQQDVAFEQLSDIMAFRVLVKDLATCYAALGALHGNYSTIPGRFKDYVSLPKSNGYRALHTGILGPEKRRIEIQIRDPEMHRIAEYGVAAHWHYKEAGQSAKRSAKGKPVAGGMAQGADSRVSADGFFGGKQLAWMRDFLEILEEAQNPAEFLEHTKMEMYRDKVFCFTPNGRLIKLPRNSCAIDFAYAIHSEVGHHCVGAKVGGRLVPLRTPLRNGDQVEILCDKKSQPSPDWEHLVVSGRARSAIRRYVRQVRRDEFIQLGKALLEKTLRNESYPVNEGALAAVLSRWHLETVQDLYVQIGENRIGPREVLHALHPETQVKQTQNRIPTRSAKSVARQVAAAVVPAIGDKGTRKGTAKAKGDAPIAIRGLIPGMAVHFARCCHPIPGDRIVGIIVTGRGVTVHTLDCENLSAYHATPERWIDISWDDKAPTPQELAGRLRVTLLNRPGGLGSLCTVIAASEGNIINLKIVNRTADFFEVNVDVEVRNLAHLQGIIAALRSNHDICNVERPRN